MQEINNKSHSSIQEVNLKDLLSKIWEYKFLFILSLGVCVTAAFFYIKLATPIYEVSTSILIETSGSNRNLSDQSQYLDGGVNLMEMENNLLNEIGIIKSFSLVKQTLEDLEFNVSYYSGNWIKRNEHYGNFPFKVILADQAPQLFNAPFIIEILSKEKYSLTIEAEEFTVSNPATNSNREIEDTFNFYGEFSFGELVEHEYFSFTLESLVDEVNMENFSELELSFIVHSYSGLANKMLSKLVAENIDINASILRIKTQGPIIKKEIDFLNKLTENYIENELITRNRIAKDKEAFISNQLTSISDSLARAERELESFKRNKQAINLDITGTNALAQTQKLQSEKAKIEFNIKYYNSLIQSINDSSGTDKVVAVSAIELDDPTLNANLLELQSLYLERVEKEIHLSDNNQEIQNINLKIKNTNKLLLEHLKSLIQSSQLALEETNQQLANYNEVIYKLPMSEIQLENIQRRNTLYENLFNYLSQELAKAVIASAESISDTRVLDPPRAVGGGPVSPQKMLLLLLSVIIGLIIPIGYISIITTFNDKIQNLDQIEERTRIPVLAKIAHYNSRARLSASDLTQWRVGESFRDLSANLQLQIPKNRNWVIGVTSTVPNEGKSFCAINLGMKLAEQGKNILIIDTDLRNPSLTDDNEEIMGKGLSNYLEGDVKSIKKVIHTHATHKNLDFIPSQVANGNIPELLSGAKMQSIFQELQDNYDYMILDAPAIGVVSDYLLLLNNIDINLFVVRRNVSKLSFLNDFNKLVSKESMQKSYIVFNDAVERAFKYGYYINTEKNKNPFLIGKSLST